MNIAWIQLAVVVSKILSAIFTIPVSVIATSSAGGSDCIGLNSIFVVQGCDVKYVLAIVSSRLVDRAVVISKILSTIRAVVVCFVTLCSAGRSSCSNMSRVLMVQSLDREVVGIGVSLCSI